MKTKLLLSALLGCGMLLTNAGFAKQGNNGGGSAQTRETLNAKLDLAPTPDTPSGARASARLTAQRTDSGQSGTLTLQTQGLAPGDYIVSAERASDHSSVDIGTVTVPDSAGGNAKTTDDLDVSGIDDPADIAKLGVFDSSGTTIFLADLTDPAGKSKEALNATVPITAGPAAPDANGRATLKSTVKKGVRKTTFTLIATGVPASSTFAVDVDGADGGTVTSNSQGKVMLKDLPEGIDTVGTVRLLDDTSTEVLRAEF